MGRILPLLGLRAFAETGRRGGMKAAATTLGVTPGAVSQQVKFLEERLGVTLFERRNRTVHLTAIGARLHGPVTRAFDQLERAVDELEAESRQRTLTVTTMPSFAASWLVPRLGRFTRDHPGHEIRVEATSEIADFRHDRVDVAIRHGLGEYPGLIATRFLTPRLVPVAAPTLLDRAIEEIADLFHYPLLQDGDRADWSLWFTAQGITDPRATRGASFTDEYLLIQAAVAGQGIALVRDVFAEGEIKGGRLVLAIDRPWPAQFAYYVVTTPDARQRPDVAAFVTWLQREAGASPQDHRQP